MKKMRKNYATRLYRLEKGVILIVALVMLLVMTIAGVTTMTGATLQERIAGNQRQRIVARINADRALKVAEAYLDSLSVSRSINTAQAAADFSGATIGVDGDGLYTSVAFLGGGIVRPLTMNRIDEDEWTVNNSIAVPDENNVASRYVIEYLGGFEPLGFGGLEDPNDPDAGASDRKVFRITAIGYGANANVVSVLESYYMEASQQ